MLKILLMSALIHPYCGPLAERQIEIHWDISSVWTFVDGGTPELARRLVGNPIYVLSPTSPHAGYGIYANGDKVELGTFNWFLMAEFDKLPVEAQGINVYDVFAEGVLPNMGEAIEWALSVYEHEGLEKPTTSWEPGFSEASKNWDTWLDHLRTNIYDHWNPKVEQWIWDKLRGIPVEPL